MSSPNVNHNVICPWVGTGGAMDASGGTAPTLTSGWLDCSGWTDKRISWEQDNAGTSDLDITLQYSPQGYYELDALVAAGTISTDDYETLAIASATSGEVMASVSAEDAGYEILQRPFRSARFVVDNDSAAAVSSFTLWFEGVS